MFRSFAIYRIVILNVNLRVCELLFVNSRSRRTKNHYDISLLAFVVTVEGEAW